MMELIKFEWKKLLQKKIVWITLVVIMVLQLLGNLAFLTGKVGYYYIDEAGKEEHYYMTGYEGMIQEIANAKAIDGRVIDDSVLPDIKEGMIGAGINPYLAIYSVVRNMIPSNWEMYEADTEELYQAWMMNLDTNILSKKFLSEGERAYWFEKIETIEIPFVYEYNLGWQKVLAQALTNSVLVVMLVAICLAGMFADEHRLKTDQMVLCMKNGRQKLYYAKAAVGLLFGIGCGVLLYAISFGIGFTFYGIDGYDAILQLDVTFSPFPMTMGEAVMMIAGITLLAAVLESALALWLSEALNNTIAVMAILVGIMMATQFVIIPDEWRVISQLWGLLPTNLGTAWALMDSKLVGVFGFYLTNFQFAAILYMVLTVLFLWLGKRKYEHFQVGAR